MVKTVLVVGGAGFIGSYVNKQLNEAGYQTIVLDNLSRGHREAVTRGTFIEGDMGNEQLLEEIFSENRIDGVMHFAAFIDVGESVKHPTRYYENNVVKTLSLLNVMRRHRVTKFIFSSTAAVYGLPEDRLISEQHSLKPINPYGRSKLMVETILKDFDEAYGVRYIAFRYFNAAGGDPDGEVQNLRQAESNLIPVVLRSLIDRDRKVTIFGTDYPTTDGTCIRDYIHIHDLATAHIIGMDKLLKGAPSNIYNLGNGHGFSVREVISAAERVTGMKVNAVDGQRRPGDPPYLVASSEKAKKELEWKPVYNNLDKIIGDAWLALNTLRSVKKN